MIKQAEAFEVHGLKLNGKLTCGENIADLGGVKLALRALKKHLSETESEAPLINGFTPVQRFFLAWSQSWRENGKFCRSVKSCANIAYMKYSKERASHSTGDFRSTRTQ
jgi:putative endopeptidase